MAIGECIAMEPIDKVAAETLDDMLIELRDEHEKVLQLLEDQDQLRTILGKLYGTAQDMHSRLSNLTSVAETQRFLDVIMEAHEALAAIPFDTPTD